MEEAKANPTMEVEKTDEPSCFGRIVKCAITTALIGTAVAIFWSLIGRPGEEALMDFGDVLDNFTDFTSAWGAEGWFGEGVEGSNTTVGRWRVPEQKGLYLELWNALDDNWQGHFENSVNEWENGSPDALALTTKRIAVDNECGHIDDVMVICNGNYGDSGYVGTNELFTSGGDNGIIYSSVAKMNEYYLYNSNRWARRYTMCHELGHGFGLGHTDEDFFNRDLGNCMDYTETPRKNLKPDTPNFETLANLYGTIATTEDSGNTALGLLEETEETIEQEIEIYAPPTQEENKEDKKEKEKEKKDKERRELQSHSVGAGKHGNLRNKPQQISAPVSIQPASTLLKDDVIRSEYENAIQELHDLHSYHPTAKRMPDASTSTSTTHEFSSRLLRSSWELSEWHPRGSTYHRYLSSTNGEEYKLEVRMLHPWGDEMKN